MAEIIDKFLLKKFPYIQCDACGNDQFKFRISDEETGFFVYVECPNCNEVVVFAEREYEPDHSDPRTADWYKDD